MAPAPTVLAVSLSPTHTFSKIPQAQIRLLANLGVEGDAHLGPTTRHRYLVKQDPARPNLTQVHLLAAELLAELASQGFPLAPGQLGENITTAGVDLLTLPTATLLHLGPEATVEVTGLRNPCGQLDRLQPGLMSAVTAHTPKGVRVPRAGIMAIVRTSGLVHAADPIRITLPPTPHRPLRCV